MASLEELLVQRTAIAKQIEMVRREERERAIREIRGLLNEHGLSVAEVVAAPGNRGGSVKLTGKKVAPTYRDPATGQTWSGRGLKPKWMVEAMAAGRLAESFLI